MTEERERLERLLRIKRPLEIHEEGDLRSWLAELEVDCQVLGASLVEKVLINAIRKRLGEKPVIHTHIEHTGKTE